MTDQRERRINDNYERDIRIQGRLVISRAAGVALLSLTGIGGLGLGAAGLGAVGSDKTGDELASCHASEDRLAAKVIEWEDFAKQVIPLVPASKSVSVPASTGYWQYGVGR